MQQPDWYYEQIELEEVALALKGSSKIPERVESVDQKVEDWILKSISDEIKTDHELEKLKDERQKFLDSL